MSTSRVFCPSRASPAARLMLDVVLPVPPLCVEKLRIISPYRVYTLDISIDSVYPPRRASKKISTLYHVTILRTIQGALRNPGVTPARQSAPPQRRFPPRSAVLGLARAAGHGAPGRG